MEITDDEVIDILFNGSQKDIDLFIRRYNVGFDFSIEYRQYTIIVRNVNPIRTLRGIMTNQVPNCTRYYGFRFNIWFDKKFGKSYNIVVRLKFSLI